MFINKDTKLFGSFSETPGNNGCEFFNKAFNRYNINAIYKSFYSIDIEKTIQSVKHLGFSGFAVSMPHKIKILDYLDEYGDGVLEIGAANTVVIKNEKLYGYNTDWIGVRDYISDDINELTILGNGGFSKAVQYACEFKKIPFKVITRNDWENVYDLKGNVFNATPVDIVTCGKLIDGRPFTQQGKIISMIQAAEQFKLYTGIEYEYKI